MPLSPFPSKLSSEGTNDKTEQIQASPFEAASSQPKWYFVTTMMDIENIASIAKLPLRKSAFIVSLS